MPPKNIRPLLCKKRNGFKAGFVFDGAAPKKAAQQLGIHRNTLEYQVRKMNAVIGGQPDEQKRFMMMCTYKMLALPDAGVPEL